MDITRLQLQPPALYYSPTTNAPPLSSPVAPVSSSHASILTAPALQFLATLQRNFNPTRKELLHRRVLQQAKYDAGALPDFLPETAYIREDPNWTGPPPMPGLTDRRVEITGPVDRKMVSRSDQSGSGA